MSGLVILLTKYLGHALMFAIMSALTSSAWFILYWVIMIISDSDQLRGCILYCFNDLTIG